ncbi:MAG: hypothetical protein ACLTSX_10225 [Collinsella sp.]
MSELEPFFNSAEECATYEQFCAEQERGGGRFELAEPRVVCRWRMARRGVPMLNRHIRALSQRVVNGAPLTTNMLSLGQAARRMVSCRRRLSRSEWRAHDGDRRQRRRSHECGPL